MLFLHGFMGRGADWSVVAESVQDRVFCLMVDLPGHGASVGLPKTAYTMDAAVEQLIEVLDAERINQCTVVGYSMGGRTALHLACRHPDRCRRLVLESASPGLDTAAQRAGRRRVDRARARSIIRDFEAFLHDWYRMPLFESIARHHLIEAIVEQRRHNVPAELAKSLHGMGAGAQQPLWERLPALRISTLAVTGALDDKYRAVTRRMAALAPHLRSVIVPGAGHNVHAERPDAFIAHLHRFTD
jgi:2-succinyl-6-hydroxy-2,4-cyclohexadiene-1-carboxylate synthase